MRGSMENIHPSVFERADEGLLRLIEKAKVGALSEDNRAVYEASLKKLADEMDMEEHGFKKGIKIGREEEKLKIARSLKNQGVDMSTISIASGLSIEEIEKL